MWSIENFFFVNIYARNIGWKKSNRYLLMLHGFEKVTTTDSEQPDDSLDLIDGLPEMSPPPIPNENSILSNNCSAPSSNGSPLSDGNNTAATLRTSSNNLVQQQERIMMNGNVNLTSSKGPTSPAASSSSISVSSTSGTTIGTLENQVSPSAGIPPPTPLIGARQESRFSFATGRTPLLPDLRATEFFRYEFFSHSRIFVGAFNNYFLSRRIVGDAAMQTIFRSKLFFHF